MADIGNTLLVRIWYWVFLSKEIANFFENRQNSENNLLTLQKVCKRLSFFYSTWLITLHCRAQYCFVESFLENALKSLFDHFRQSLLKFLNISNVLNILETFTKFEIFKTSSKDCLEWSNKDWKALSKMLSIK